MTALMLVGAVVVAGVIELGATLVMGRSRPARVTSRPSLRPLSAR